MPAILGKLWNTDFHLLTTDDLWNHYKDCLIAHDWTYDFSDDHQVWEVGKEEGHHLNAVKTILEEVDRDRANKMYWHHSFFFNDDGTPKT